MINELIKLADFLDSRGLCKEADYLDDMLKKHAGMSDEQQSFLELIEYFVGENVIPKLKRNIIKGHIVPEGAGGNISYKEKDLGASLITLQETKAAFNSAKDDYNPPLTDDDIGYWLSDAGRLHGGAEVEPFIANLRTSFGLLAAANTDSAGGVANA